MPADQDGQRRTGSLCRPWGGTKRQPLAVTSKFYADAPKTAVPLMATQGLLQKWLNSHKSLF